MNLNLKVRNNYLINNKIIKVCVSRNGKDVAEVLTSLQVRYTGCSENIVFLPRICHFSLDFAAIVQKMISQLE